MGFRYLGQPRIFGEVFGNSAKQQSLAAYLAGLGGVAVYDGILAPDGRNLGTGGSALNGTLTAVTTNATGFVSDGAASSGSLMAVAANAAVGSLPAYTYVIVGQAASTGGNTGGRLWDYANGGTHAGFVSGANLVLRVARAVQASTTFTNFFPSYPSTAFIVFMQWSGTAIEGYAAKAGDASYTAGTNVDGSGTVTDQSAAQWNILNRTLRDRTWHGYMRLFAVINRVLTADERLVIGRSAGIINP